MFDITAPHNNHHRGSHHPSTYGSCIPAGTAPALDPSCGIAFAAAAGSSRGCARERRFGAVSSKRLWRAWAGDGRGVGGRLLGSRFRERLLVIWWKFPKCAEGKAYELIDGAASSTLGYLQETIL